VQSDIIHLAGRSGINAKEAAHLLVSVKGGKKSRAEPKLLAGGMAKIAPFALQKIEFSNGCYWREADVRGDWR
jgi:hypothetical protein